MFIPVRWIKQNVALKFNLQTNKMTIEAIISF